MTDPTPTQVFDWERRYRDGATPWESAALNPAFLAWRAEGTLAPCRILFPGAGRSLEPAALASAGFDVTVVDVAASANAVQQARLGTRGRAITADLLEWQTDRPFDAIYEQTCLCALPPAIWPAYAARLAAWLRPGGRLFALLLQRGCEGGPPFDCSIPAMRVLFDRTHWTWPETLPAPVPNALGYLDQPAVLLRGQSLA